MRAICVEDEKLIMELTVSMCRELPDLDEVFGFLRAGDALDWLEGNSADLALLDINLPDMDGIALARAIREKQPDISIIFLTGYTEYALDAFALHASGYLVKPISKKRLQEEVSYALAGKRNPAPPRVLVKTFGNFDVEANGQTVSFRRSKSKELLAYLVDRHGSSVTRAQAFAILWEDRTYDRSMQKQMDVIIRSLRSTLEEYGIEDILDIRSGQMRIVPERLDCDLYHVLEGDGEAMHSYRGEYMSSYAWAELTEAYMSRLPQS